jgi:hypothetical protein
MPANDASFRSNYWTGLGAILVLTTVILWAGNNSKLTIAGTEPPKVSISNHGRLLQGIAGLANLNFLTQNRQTLVAQLKLNQPPGLYAEVKNQAQNLVSENTLMRNRIRRSLIETAGVAVVLIAGALWFALVGPPRIPPTYATSVCLYALSLGCSLFCGFGAFMGWTILHLKPYPTPGFMHYVLGTVFWIPLAGLVFAYAHPPHWRLLAGAPLSFGPKDNQGLDIRNILNELARDLGLRHPISAITTPDSYSPVVIGSRPSNAVLVLPATLNHHVLSACKNDLSLAHALLRLLLAHELSHVRNGDIRFLPLLQALHRSLPLGFAVVLGVFLLAKIIDSQDLAVRIANPSWRLFLLGTLLLGVLTKLALNERERLADATAVLVMPEEDLQKVLNKDELGNSPLQRLLVSLRCYTAFSGAVLGFRMTPSMPRWWLHLGAYFRRKSMANTLVSINHSDSRRQNELVDKLVSFPVEVEIPWITWIALGSVGGLILAGFTHLLLVDFMKSLQAFRSSPADSLTSGFLQAHRYWTQFQANNLGWAEIRQLLPLALCCLLVGGVLLPLRDLPHGFGSITIPVGLQVVLSLLASMLFASMVFAMLSPARQPEFPSFPALSLSPLHLMLWMPLVITFFTGTLIMRFATPSGRVPWFLLETSVHLIFVVVGYLCCYAILTGLTLPGRLLYAFALIASSATISQRPWFNRFAAERVYSSESIRWIQLWGKARIFVNPTGGIVRLRFDVLPWFCSYTVLLYVLTPATFAILTRPALIAIDGLFPMAFENMVLFGKPIRLSTLISLSFIVVVFAYSTIRAGYSAVHGQPESDRIIAKAEAMAILLDHLKLYEIRSHLANVLLKAIKVAQFRSHEYVSEFPELPLLQRTCGIIRCCHCLGMPSSTTSSMQEWVKQCESPGGGFGPVPGSVPFLPHTIAALRILDRLHKLPESAIAVHSTWLQLELSWLINSPDTQRSGDWLGGVSLVTEGLRLCGIAAPLKAFPIPEIIGRSRQLWLANRRNTHDTMNVLRVLNCCLPDAAKDLEWFRDTWLPSAETRWLTLNPGTHIQELADACEILDILVREDTQRHSSKMRISDNVTKSFWRSSFDLS